MQNMQRSPLTPARRRDAALAAAGCAATLAAGSGAAGSALATAGRAPRQRAPCFTIWPAAIKAAGRQEVPEKRKFCTSQLFTRTFFSPSFAGHVEEVGPPPSLV